LTSVYEVAFFLQVC